MKHLKMLGLAVVAAAAFMAFASSASAGIVTSTAGVDYTGEINATASSGTTLLLKAGFANITCTESTVKGKIEKNESTASGKIGTLSFSSCNATVDVLKNGSLEIRSTSTVGDHDGTLFGSESEVTVSLLGTSCVYGTSTGTHLGTLTGKTAGEGDAILHLEASLPRISGGFACANPASWTGTYTVTSPTPLWVD